MLRLKDWREVISEDWPKIEITKQTVLNMREAVLSGRYLFSDMRLATGRFYTDSEYETRRAKVLAAPLP